MGSETRPSAAGGFHSIKYTLRMARKAERGGMRAFYKALRSKNVCKACALGQKRMKNEIDQGFQVCKKAMQAVAQDLLSGINPEFFENNSINDLAQMRGYELEKAGRIIEPMITQEGSTHFQPISWQEAYNMVLEQFKQVDPDRSFFYTSGRSSNEAAFLTQILGRQFGMNNVNNCSYYCHQASGVGLKQTIGSGTATVTLDDVEHADMVVLIGANPSSNHPRFITHLVDLRKRGGKVVIVNPFVEVGLKRYKIPSKLGSLFFTSTVSDIYLQPHCGGDLAFLKAVGHELVRREAYDEDFLTKHCQNWEELKNDLEKQYIDDLVLKSGIPKQKIIDFVDMLLDHDNIIFSWAMGVTHQKHGVETVRMIANIQLMLGNVGRLHAGLLPLRGHSNVQGVGSVGVVPKLAPEIIENIVEHLNVDVPKTEGLDTFASMEAAKSGDIDFALMLGGNLYGANPDSQWSSKALRNIDFTVYISTTLNRGHIHGRGKTSLILPVRVRDEEKQSTTQESMFNYVRISEGGMDSPVPSLPTEVELFTYLGNELYGNNPVPWQGFQDHTVIREFIAKTIPNLQPLKNLTKEGGEFHIPGRIKHQPQFNTDNGKANLWIGEAPDGRAREGYYNMLTFRSENQFNTIIYDEDDPFRGVDHRKVVFMNQIDIDREDINDGDWIYLQSSTGRLKVHVVEAPIRRGNVATFFPEGNILVPRIIDPQSKTPVFKRVEVSISQLDQ